MSVAGSILLHDEASGSTASILPSLGFNCYNFQAVVTEDPVQVLWAAPDFGEPGSRPSRSGIPILFPFGGRLRGQSFT
ncbi:MAG: aldose 1-epimerase, partial [Chloroflexota bacterium]|nr:aldose 1-epimerase [Chloroflexota bacterium]